MNMQMNMELDEDLTEEVLNTISSDSIQTWELVDLLPMELRIRTSYVKILKAQLEINKLFLQNSSFVSVADLLAFLDEKLVFNEEIQADLMTAGWDYVCYEGMDFPWIGFKKTHYYNEHGELIFRIRFVDQAFRSKPPCMSAYDCSGQHYGNYYCEQ